MTFSKLTRQIHSGLLFTELQQRKQTKNAVERIINPLVYSLYRLNQPLHVRDGVV